MEIKTLQYGEVDTKEYVPGAEILLEEKEEEVRNSPNQDQLFFIAFNPVLLYHSGI